MVPFSEEFYFGVPYLGEYLLITVTLSLVPRPIQKIGEKGLVSTVYACA